MSLNITKHFNLLLAYAKINFSFAFQELEVNQIHYKCRTKTNNFSGVLHIYKR